MTELIIAHLFLDNAWAVMVVFLSFAMSTASRGMPVSPTSLVVNVGHGQRFEYSELIDIHDARTKHSKAVSLKRVSYPRCFGAWGKATGYSIE